MMHPEILRMLTVEHLNDLHSQARKWRLAESIREKRRAGRRRHR